MVGNAISYQWELSHDNSKFSPITGEIKDKYKDNPKVGGNFYRLNVTSGKCKQTSKTIKLTITNPFTTPQIRRDK